MKKLMFALVAAGAVAVMGEEIASQNVVGYTQLSNPAPKSYVMVANSFQNPGGVTLDLNKIATTATPAAYSVRKTSAPMLKVWDPTYGSGRYVTYYYITDAYDEDADEEYTAWADENGDVVSNVTLPLGSALWFICQTETGKTVTLAGEVSGENTLTVSATTAGYTMIANPFPEVTDFNAVTWKATDGETALTPADYNTRKTDAPMIKVWDPTYGSGRYLTYYYITDAYDEDADEEYTAWADENGDVAAGSVGAGQGFWLILPSSYTGAKAIFTK